MPDRFRRFDSDEIKVMHEALEAESVIYHRLGWDDSLASNLVNRLLSELEDEILQQTHRAHRELHPS